MVYTLVGGHPERYTLWYICLPTMLRGTPCGIYASHTRVGTPCVYMPPIPGYVAPVQRVYRAVCTYAGIMPGREASLGSEERESCWAERPPFFERKRESCWAERPPFSLGERRNHAG